MRLSEYSKYAGAGKEVEISDRLGSAQASLHTASIVSGQLRMLGAQVQVKKGYFGLMRQLESRTIAIDLWRQPLPGRTSYVTCLYPSVIFFLPCHFATVSSTIFYAASDVALGRERVRRVSGQASRMVGVSFMVV